MQEEKLDTIKRTGNRYSFHLLCISGVKMCYFFMSVTISVIVLFMFYVCVGQFWPFYHNEII